MQRLEVSGAVRPIYGPLGVKVLKMGPVGCPATSVTNYEGTVRNTPGGQKDKHIPTNTTINGVEKNFILF